MTETTRLTYKRYISSELWKLKRQERLDFDNGLCVVCHRPAVSVHHPCYPEVFGEEDVQNELISVCQVHHAMFDNIERWQRYSRRQHQVDVVSTTIQIRQEANHGLEGSSLQVDIHCSTAAPQRADCRSTQQVVSCDETHFRQTEEGRRRL